MTAAELAELAAAGFCRISPCTFTRPAKPGRGTQVIAAEGRPEVWCIYIYGGERVECERLGDAIRTYDEELAR